MSEQAEPIKTQQVDFLVWLKQRGFVVDDMENMLDDTWKPFEFSFKDGGEKNITVKWKAKRGLDATKPDQHTLISDVQFVNLPDDVKVKKISQAELGPIRRDEIDPHPFRKYPRNMKCFCGSGKKFKVCHIELIPHWCLKKDTPQLKAMFTAFMDNFKGREEHIQATAEHLKKTEH